MTDHNDTPSTPDGHQPETDDRIDALARAAGGELRRPAPVDGLHRAQRSKRRRDVARVAATSAAFVLVAAGALTWMGQDNTSDRVPVTQDDTAGPTSSVATSTTATSSSTTTSTTSPSTSTTSPTSSTSTSTAAPSPVVVPPNAAGDPTAVYTFVGDIATSGTTETVIDPSDGSVIETRPVDFASSQAAQDALLGRTALQSESTVVSGSPENFGYIVSTYRTGGLTLRTEALPTDAPSFDDFDTATLERFDACGQSTLVVEGAARGELPERVKSIVVSVDGRWIATIETDCPLDGTLADPERLVGQTPWRVTLFDATALAQPGRVLYEGTRPSTSVEVWFSPDGGFVAVASDTYRFYDLPADSVQAVDLEGCPPLTTTWARFIGPWIGDSSIALVLDCEDVDRLLVRDMVTGEELRIDLPAGARAVDVDHAHYDRPANVWFTACDAFGTCWLGQGGGELRELADTSQASFLPLGFTYGG